MKLDNYPKAFEGQQAYHDGKGISDNPYVDDRDNQAGAYQWLTGYRIALVLSKKPKAMVLMGPLAEATLTLSDRSKDITQRLSEITVSLIIEEVLK